jgi:hypothetical protein
MPDDKKETEQEEKAEKKELTKERAEPTFLLMRKEESRFLLMIIQSHLYNLICNAKSYINSYIRLVQTRGKIASRYSFLPLVSCLFLVKGTILRHSRHHDFGTSLYEGELYVGTDACARVGFSILQTRRTWFI